MITNQHSVKFWLLICMLAAGVALLIFSRGDVALQIAGGTTVTAAVALIGQVIRGESRQDHVTNATRTEIVAEKVETVETKLDETAHSLLLKQDKRKDHK